MSNGIKIYIDMKHNVKDCTVMLLRKEKELKNYKSMKWHIRYDVMYTNTRVVQTHIITCYPYSISYSISSVYKHNINFTSFLLYTLCIFTNTPSLHITLFYFIVHLHLLTFHYQKLTPSLIFFTFF